MTVFTTSRNKRSSISPNRSWKTSAQKLRANLCSRWLEGSARAQKASELQQLYDLEAQNVADQALDYENKARTNVENARSDLVATLNATGDATGAANSALARSATLSQPEAYSPLTDLFAGYTDALGTAAAAERARAYGWGSQTKTGLPSWYGAPPSSVTVKG